MELTRELIEVFDKTIELFRAESRAEYEKPTLNADAGNNSEKHQALKTVERILESTKKRWIDSLENKTKTSDDTSDNMDFNVTEWLVYYVEKMNSLYRASMPTWKLLYDKELENGDISEKEAKAYGVALRDVNVELEKIQNDIEEAIIREKASPELETIYNELVTRWEAICKEWIDSFEYADNYDDLLQEYGEKASIDQDELEFGFASDARNTEALAKQYSMIKNVVDMISDIRKGLISGDTIGDYAKRNKKKIEGLIKDIRETKKESTLVIEREQSLISNADKLLGYLDQIRKG